ncbi:MULTISPECIES: glycosyltransferase [Methylosinus]|uniref:Glycosyltransferase n=1 Tax=Methylosinus trichosporium (strain ATCC 35070 / NCIMB 11131 / UNIQEM 75 / OB3b) TaxID=595536 RepID=A0A2D2D1R8_METT3|nr:MULTISPECIES: glycosyltransferase [Methylosinus]ATQ68937.1 glycosyltransferase [Methylosinus trichosporium OB3b]OBS52273.1 glycosyltransferase [Methylosinus sp. 3S-1]
MRNDDFPKARILVLGWEGGGNVPPILAVIRALAARGHDLRFIGDDCLLAEARGAGARAQAWRRAPNRPDRSASSCFVREWEQPDALAGVRAWARTIFLGPAELYAMDVVDAAREEPTDLVIGADLLFGGMIAAEALGLPLALLSPNVSIVPQPGHPPFGPGFTPATNEAERQRDREAGAMVEQMFDGFLPQINAARARFGLSPLPRTLDQFRADRLLLATSGAFDFPVSRLPDHVRYVGPILEQPSWVSRSTPVAPGDRPLALVSFSTTYQKQEAALEATLDALATLSMRGIVTLGKALAGHEMTAPPNVEIRDGASHDDILPHAACVVTHGGHGTTLRALAAGVPVLVLPMGRDQNDNAARVDYHRLGLRLPPTASAEEIARALRRLVEEPHFVRNAKRFAQTIAAEGGGAERCADEIEGLIRAPFLRHAVGM